MAARKNPEERSTATERPPAEAVAQPADEETLSAATSAASSTIESEPTPEEQAELDELERAAAEAYEQLGKAAQRLSERAADAYRSGRTFVQDNPGGTLLSSFAIGVLVGVLFSRR